MYLLFTSGSTGTPKGVPVSWDNVDSFLAEVVPRYDLGPGCRLSQNFDLTFDLSVFDLWCAWTTGSTLVVPSADELLDPVRYVRDRELTHWFSVPAAVGLARDRDTLRPDLMSSLRWSLFCGDTLTHAAVRAWCLCASRSRVENLYGPTELTVSCTSFRVPTPPPQDRDESVPIGRLHPGHELVILDAEMTPATTGLLCVRGRQRFAGYLASSDDQGRFVDGPDLSGRFVPTAVVSSESWYVTGDLVRETPNGLLHLGRVDEQVKINGYRVELEEIESMGRTVPGVSDCVALKASDDRGRPVLCLAYLGGARVVERDIRGKLAATLPTHAIPRVLLELSEIPRNQNGKVDREAIRELVTRAERVRRESRDADK